MNKGFIIYGKGHYVNFRTLVYKDGQVEVSIMEWSHIRDIKANEPLVFNKEHVAIKRLALDDEHYKVKYHYTKYDITSNIYRVYRLRRGEAEVIKYDDLLMEIAEEKLRGTT